MGNADKYVRNGGRKRHITRQKQGQVIPSIYATSPEARRAYNSKINQVHVNRGKCS